MELLQSPKASNLFYYDPVKESRPLEDLLKEMPNNTALLYKVGGDKYILIVKEEESFALVTINGEVESVESSDKGYVLKTSAGKVEIKIQGGDITIAYEGKSLETLTSPETGGRHATYPQSKMGRGIVALYPSWLPLEEVLEALNVPKPPKL